jgi:O-methyltransferase
MTLGIKGIDSQLSSMETLQSSYDIARMAIENNVAGDFVECGVFAGSQCAAMALALMDCKVTDRCVHLFDSFAGVPAPTAQDREWVAAGYAAGHSAASVDEVARNMHRWGIDGSLLAYHAGWFKDTLPSKDWTSRIAILRLDADLYESTKICLEWLFPLLSPAGWLIIDDYCLSGARQACDEYFGGNYPPVYFQKRA